MLSSGMLCHVALVRIDVSEELVTSIIRVKRISKLVTVFAITTVKISSQCVSVDSYC
jgi:hypothetical protein